MVALKVLKQGEGREELANLKRITDMADKVDPDEGQYVVKLLDNFSMSVSWDATFALFWKRCGKIRKVLSKGLVMKRGLLWYKGLHGNLLEEWICSINAELCIMVM